MVKTIIMAWEIVLKHFHWKKNKRPLLELVGLNLKAAVHYSVKPRVPELQNRRDYLMTINRLGAPFDCYGDSVKKN